MRTFTYFKITQPITCGCHACNQCPTGSIFQYYGTSYSHTGIQIYRSNSLLSQNGIKGVSNHFLYKDGIQYIYPHHIRDFQTLTLVK